MNKKFSTLMACAMLAGSMSAYSQTSHGVTGKWGNPSETRYRTQNTAVTALGASVERNTAVFARKKLALYLLKQKAARTTQYRTRSMAVREETTWKVQ